MQPVLDHVQITVKDINETEMFYDQFMPLLGFDLHRKLKGRVTQHDFDVIEYCHPLLIIGFNSPREAFKNEEVHRRKPGALHHLAFRASSCAEVDELFLKVRDIGANIIESPKFFPQHGANYYATFFKDPNGIKLEIMFEDRQPV